MNSLEIISTFIYNNTEKFSVHVWKDFDLSVWKIKHYFCLLWISKIFITHLTRQRTENDPRRSVFWSAHQRLVIIKPSLKQTLFSFSSMKVGFIYCEFLLVGDENNTSCSRLKLRVIQLPRRLLTFICMFFVFQRILLMNNSYFFISELTEQSSHPKGFMLQKLLGSKTSSHKSRPTSQNWDQLVSWITDMWPDRGRLWVLDSDVYTLKLCLKG